MRSVSRHAVEDAVSVGLGDRCTALTVKGTPAFRQAWNRRRVRRLQELGQDKIGMSVAALAAYSSCFGVTDNRDRLYGLRALATNTFLLKVDYSAKQRQILYPQRFVSGLHGHGVSKSTAKVSRAFCATAKKLPILFIHHRSRGLQS